jgi:3-oxoacyl-[acyl-carrier-protein] synthase II
MLDTGPTPVTTTLFPVTAAKGMDAGRGHPEQRPYSGAAGPGCATHDDMTPDTPVPVIVGWSVLSPLGAGRRAFTDRLSEGGRPRRRLTDDAFAGLAGAKGTRALDRMTLMVIATAGLLLGEHADVVSARYGEVGLVLGTSMGSVASTTAFLQDTFTQDRPYLVNPTMFPNTVMNGAAGHTAIWYGLTGLNSTVACGHLTGIAALRYAHRMIRCGYAETLLVGCVEEVSAPVASAARALRRADAGHGPALGEGCAMFLLTAAGNAAGQAAEESAVPLAQVIGFEAGMTVQDGAAARADRLAAALRSLLARTGTAADDLWLVSLAHAGTGDLGRVERAAVDDVMPGPAAPPRLTVAGQIGDCFSASGAFQLAATLATAQAAPWPAARLALLTSAGADGAVGCALVRVLSTAGSRQADR